MRLLALALANLGRHGRRSLVTGLAVAFGALAIVTLQGLANGLVDGLVALSVRNRVGAVQVQRAGYLGADDPLALTFADDPALVARLRGVPGVTAVAPRLDFDGMLSNGAEATMFVATGVDPTAEYRVCPLREAHVAPGSRALRPGDERGVLVGKTLARSLGAAPGASLVMQAAGLRGATNALDVEVVGLLPSTHPMESKRLATVPLAFAQALLRMPGALGQYVLGVDDLSEVEAVAARVGAVVGPGWEVTTWRDVDPGTRDRATMFRVLLGLIAAVLFALVATGIVNTMAMAVHERVREIGTMLALGVRRRAVRLLFLVEAAALGFASAGAGGLTGWLLIAVVGRNGLSLRTPGGDVMPMVPAVGPGFVALVIAFAVAGAVLAALLPAHRAARLRPVDALRAL